MAETNAVVSSAKEGSKESLTIETKHDECAEASCMSSPVQRDPQSSNADDNNDPSAKPDFPETVNSDSITSAVAIPLSEQETTLVPEQAVSKGNSKSKSPKRKSRLVTRSSKRVRPKHSDQPAAEKKVTLHDITAAGSTAATLQAISSQDTSSLSLLRYVSGTQGDGTSEGVNGSALAVGEKTLVAQDRLTEATVGLEANSETEKDGFGNSDSVPLQQSFKDPVSSDNDVEGPAAAPKHDLAEGKVSLIEEMPPLSQSDEEESETPGRKGVSDSLKHHHHASSKIKSPDTSDEKPEKEEQKIDDSEGKEVKETEQSADNKSSINLSGEKGKQLVASSQDKGQINERHYIAGSHFFLYRSMEDYRIAECQYCGHLFRFCTEESLLKSISRLPLHLTRDCTCCPDSLKMNLLRLDKQKRHQYPISVTEFTSQVWNLPAPVLSFDEMMRTERISTSMTSKRQSGSRKADKNLVSPHFSRRRSKANPIASVNDDVWVHSEPNVLDEEHKPSRNKSKTGRRSTDKVTKVIHNTRNATRRKGVSATEVMKGNHSAPSSQSLPAHTAASSETDAISATNANTEDGTEVVEGDHSSLPIQLQLSQTASATSSKTDAAQNMIPETNSSKDDGTKVVREDRSAPPPQSQPAQTDTAASKIVATQHILPAINSCTEDGTEVVKGDRSAPPPQSQPAQTDTAASKPVATQNIISVTNATTEEGTEVVTVEHSAPPSHSQANQIADASDNNTTRNIVYVANAYAEDGAEAAEGDPFAPPLLSQATQADATQNVIPLSNANGANETEVVKGDRSVPSPQAPRIANATHKMIPVSNSYTEDGDDQEKVIGKVSAKIGANSADTENGHGLARSAVYNRKARPVGKNNQKSLPKVKPGEMRNRPRRVSAAGSSQPNKADKDRNDEKSSTRSVKKSRKERVSSQSSKRIRRSVQGIDFSEENDESVDNSHVRKRPRRSAAAAAVALIGLSLTENNISETYRADRDEAEEGQNRKPSRDAGSRPSPDEAAKENEDEHWRIIDDGSAPLLEVYEVMSRYGREKMKEACARKGKPYRASRIVKIFDELEKCIDNGHHIDILTSVLERIRGRKSIYSISDYFTDLIARAENMIRHPDAPIDTTHSQVPKIRLHSDESSTYIEETAFLYHDPITCAEAWNSPEEGTDHPSVLPPAPDIYGCFEADSEDKHYSFKYHFEEEQRVLLCDFSGLAYDQLSTRDLKFFASMLERDDITVVSEGLVDPDILDQDMWDLKVSLYGLEWAPADSYQFLNLLNDLSFSA